VKPENENYQNERYMLTLQTQHQTHIKTKKGTTAGGRSSLL